MEQGGVKKKDNNNVNLNNNLIFNPIQNTYIFPRLRSSSRIDDAISYFSCSTALFMASNSILSDSALYGNAIAGLPGMSGVDWLFINSAVAYNGFLLIRCSKTASVARKQKSSISPSPTILA